MPLLQVLNHFEWDREVYLQAISYKLTFEGLQVFIKDPSQLYGWRCLGKQACNSLDFIKCYDLFLKSVIDGIANLCDLFIWNTYLKGISIKKVFKY